MMALQWGFDLTLGLSIIWLAWRLLFSPDLFKAIVLFIAFGLLMSIIWVRLGAEDIALAEAAIGAGITGALLLSNCVEICRRQVLSTTTPSGGRDSPFSILVFIVIPLIGLVFYLGFAIDLLPLPWDGLSKEVESMLTASGSGSPVTAVLLNFRGYDTLLEITVMLLSVIGIWSLGSAPKQRRGAQHSSGPILISFIRPLIPLMVIVSAYLLWSGKNGVGGAFQAGAVLGSAGVLILLSDRPFFRPPQVGILRLFLVIGVVFFLASALFPMLAGYPFLHFPLSLAGSIILLIEILATISIAFTLTLLFYGGEP